jgi:hypothetical protein
MGADHAGFSGEWTLWRDFVVRSAGFPVEGLEVFGGEDEGARLREVAADPAFREAVTWQNPAVVANSLDKVLKDGPVKPSKLRRRQESIAIYWQRYCAKNDTIGFFGPLAWGRVSDDAPRLRARVGELIRECEVRFEAWGIQALAETIDPSMRVPTGMRPERDLRMLLEEHPEAAVRERGLVLLDQVVAALARIEACRGEDLRAALADLDQLFTELTEREPTRHHGRAYGARTLAYIDCTRDLDVEVGPDFLADVTPVIRAVLEAGRWYCGRVNEVAKGIIAEVLGQIQGAPASAVVGRILGQLMQLPPGLRPEVAELQRRFGELLTDPDPATLAERARVAFADHDPAWSFAAESSFDLQIAAPSVEAIVAGDYLAVVADIHAANNPLDQELFGTRHPDPERFIEMTVDDYGHKPVAILLPPWGHGMGVDARGAPMLFPGDVAVTLLDSVEGPLDRETLRLSECMVEGDEVVHRDGRRIPIIDVMALPTFVASVRTLELFEDAEHIDRLTIGKVVLRRETWNPLASEVPLDRAALRGWAAERGMPRRVFAKTPVERKPFYVDLKSDLLTGILVRHVREAAREEGARIRFTEMLPGPDECWVTDRDGRSYACELRFVAVDSATADRRRESPGAKRP